MKPLSVHDVIKVLQEEERKGNGDKILLVSDDEECNGFHPLFNNYLEGVDVMHYYEGDKLIAAECIHIS